MTNPKECENRLAAWADFIEQGYEAPAAGPVMREAANILRIYRKGYDAAKRNQRTAQAYAERLEARVERLEAALKRLADCDWVITPADRMDGVRAIAREALKDE